MGLFVVFEAVHLLVALGGGPILEDLLPGDAGRWRGPAAWALYTVLAVIPVAALGWWRQTGLTRPGRASALTLLVPPLLAGLPFLAVGIHLDPADAVPLLLIGTPLIALNEELFFRGLLLELLRPIGWRRAITATAVLFGLAHAVNLASGAYPPFVALQVLATTAGGVAFAAIRIRSGSLWPLIGLHIALDVIALSTMTGAGPSSPIVLPVVLTWGALNALLWPYGWRLLRGRSDVDLDALYEGGLRATAAQDDPAAQPDARQASPT